MFFNEKITGSERFDNNTLDAPYSLQEHLRPQFPILGGFLLGKGHVMEGESTVVKFWVKKQRNTRRGLALR